MAYLVEIDLSGLVRILIKCEDTLEKIHQGAHKKAD